MMKGNENATLQPDLQKILNALQHMMDAMGFYGVDDKRFDI